MELFDLLVQCKLAGMTDEDTHAVGRVFTGKSLDSSMMVQDVTGRRMTPNTPYTLRGNKVLVLNEEYGTDNLLDTYYRVFYLDTNLKLQTEVVEVRYATRLSPSYPSLFTPIESSS